MAISVAWVPTKADINRGSFRLQCLYNHQWLLEHGIHSEIIEYDTRPRGSWKNKFQFLVWFRTDVPQDAVAHEVPIIYFVSDGPVPSPFYLNQAIAIVTDAPVIARTTLAAWPGKTHVVPVTAAGDVPIESLRCQQPAPSPHEEVKLVWIGTEQNYWWAKETLDCLSKRFKVTTISKGPFCTNQWSLQTVVQDIKRCHIGIVPFPRDLRFGDLKGFNPTAKDIDRITLLQACGLPVIASPLPSYVEYIRQGVDGIIADGPEEFDHAVNLLCQSPDLYRSIANAGCVRAWMTAAPTVTGNKWRTILENLKRDKPNENKVDPYVL